MENGTGRNGTGGGRGRGGALTGARRGPDQQPSGCSARVRDIDSHLAFIPRVEARCVTFASLQSMGMIPARQGSPATFPSRPR